MSDGHDSLVALSDEPPLSDDELIDASEVASLLGLSHRNSVSTYRNRYPDFPPGQPAPGGGRSRLWRRGEILGWQRAFRGRGAEDSAVNTKLNDLVAATIRLMLAQPGVDVSIRQIAAEAGVAHSDLYRYAISKERLRDLAVEQIVRDFATQIPPDYRTFSDRVGGLLDSVRANRSALSVIAHEMITAGGKTVPLPENLAIQRIARVIAAHNAEQGRSDGVDPRVVSACLGAMAWGLILFEDRWRTGLGLDDIPHEQVTRVARAMLDA